MADTFQTIRCPACGSTMKKIFVPSAGVNVDICADGCGGIFFDSKELKTFESGSQANISEIDDVLAGKNFDPVDTEQTRICPVCATKMIKTKINGLDVIIDTCYNCGGVYLDNGELKQIREGFSRTSVTKVKEQNATLDSRLLREFYAEAQREEQDYKLLNSALDVLNGGFYRPSRGLISLLHNLFR